MASTSSASKDIFIDPISHSTPASTAWSYFNPLSPLSNAYDRVQQWRADLGLPNPGTTENLQKEVRATTLTNLMFDGGRADLSKTLSANPLFQVTHSFSLGSSQVPPSYNFASVYATDSVFLQGSIDHDGNVNMRANQGWSPNSVSKVQGQFSQQSGHHMVLEHDYHGRDFTINLKAMDPWPADMTGMFTGSYLQSFTKNIAVGFESLWQRAPPLANDVMTSYLLKWTSDDKNTISTAQVQSGILQATYWQKLSEKVDVAADLQVVALPQRRDAVATLACKYELRLAAFRAQLDSTGKVSAFLEQRFSPAFSFLVAGEIDHFKNAAKFGVGVMIESSTLTPEEMGLPPQPSGI
ncbi:eukaryotic porin-domain-containing protein [Schizophyllum commune]|uniref:Mitochondrial import receptor subunit TOM40 n=1 Tax=Schizophyllum commune (strain H4-8 / FGSC 9210) TaxID=578458 RepID=D8PT00_SCHCM|nr:uncharacterized protein SCHCODRAFT_02484424 [Schizophyllum commune H4-8]KAI5899485.1 hypothetical protein SCHCODRAFT_02484424 [Schizophyllum commune H4-8]